VAIVHLGYILFADRLVFYNLPGWIFSVAYLWFALAVAAVFIIAPPQWRS
jgi:hypothetical protein